MDNYATAAKLIIELERRMPLDYLMPIIIKALVKLEKESPKAELRAKLAEYFNED